MTPWAKLDFRTRVGLCLTALWLGCAGLYVWVAWPDFADLKPNSVGDFLAGVAAPLALFWLTLGYFQQGEELELQRKELTLQRAEVERLAEETERQRKAVEASELHARRDTFMRFRELLIEELSELAKLLTISVDGADVGGKRVILGGERLREQFRAGNKDVYFDALVTCVIQGTHQWFSGAIGKVMSGDQMVARYCELVEDLLRNASDADPTDELRKFIEMSKICSTYWGLASLTGRKSKLKFRQII